MKTWILQTPGKNGNGSGRFHFLAKVQTLVLASTVFCAANSFAAPNYVAHEWGTFTSVQGGNGELLPWRPLQSSELPGFVYDWTKAGMNRGSLIGPKIGLITLQRLETPVIYFYANEPMQVSVDVRFPKGCITEWFPQATQIGPTFPLKPNVSTNGILSESRAVWQNLGIIPPSTEPENALPHDTSGSHYFAARATGANVVQANILTSANKSEMEKFIFYRGAGSFKTPLRVTVNSNNVVSVENTGERDLAHLFLVLIKTNDVSGGWMGGLAQLDNLPAGTTVEWQNLDGVAPDGWKSFPLERFQNEISSQMEAALTAEGLFPDEARAMVNTWKDSWFTEEGLRVLYILPRAWTDEILPITMTPPPTQLTRVMVGRAEIIAPDVEMNLFHLLTRGRDGDDAARGQAAEVLKRLGRFAMPALSLANNHATGTNVTTLGYELLNSVK